MPSGRSGIVIDQAEQSSVYCITPRILTCPETGIVKVSALSCLYLKEI